MRHNDTVSVATAADGVRIHYVVRGDGPPVLLLHGISADGEMNWEWTGIAPALRESGFRTVVVDQRGHGQSDKPHRPEAYEDARFASDVSAVLDHASLDHAALVGYSMGGYMALRAAAVEPRIRVLVVGGIDDAAPHPRTREAVARALEAADGAALPDGEPRSIREYADMTGADRLALAAIQRGRSDAPFDFRSITVPTLVVTGEHDECAAGSARVAAAITGAVLVVVPGDHASALLDAELKDSIRDFLRDQLRP
jgi:pimeloyl-ACP methyl ester carboxylesterase